MSGGMFLMRPSGELVEMRESPYDSENQLQTWLAHHPSLLAGDQIDPKTPRRWLLVSREAAVPGELEGAGRWSLDHLFLDQDAIPTLIEVKRSSDTRIRREIVGQLLDYAANAMVYWPAGTMRSMFESRCTREGADADARMAEFLSLDDDSDDPVDRQAFWATADENLQSGRVRLVFVADTIPRELQRVIEFLNAQMGETEVLGVEVRRFEGPPGTDLRTIVPRVVGHTATADRKKRPGGVRPKPQFPPISPDALLGLLETAGGPPQRAKGERVLAWADARGLERGGTHLQIMLRASDASGQPHRLVALRYETKSVSPPQGTLGFRADMITKAKAFSSASAWKTLVDKLTVASGNHLGRADGMFPFVRLDQIDGKQLDAVLEVLDWVIAEIAKQ